MALKSFRMEMQPQTERSSQQSRVETKEGRRQRGENEAEVEDGGGGTSRNVEVVDGNVVAVDGWWDRW